MKLGTVIELPDGRVGTICWHNLDGYGGVWGRVDFLGNLGRPEDCGFSDKIPPPDFMLRNKDVEELVQDNNPYGHVECVGEQFKGDMK